MSGLINRPDRVLVAKGINLITSGKEKTPISNARETNENENKNLNIYRHLSSSVTEMSILNNGESYGSKYFWHIIYTRFRRAINNTRDCKN